MSYQVPPRWAMGDYPTAALINKYKDGIDAIHAALGDYGVNWPAASRAGAHVQGFYFLHSLRWLCYRGAGRIEDPAGVGETVTLSGDGVNWTSYDLDSIDWMVQGKLYQVQAVTSCMEDSEAVG